MSDSRAFTYFIDTQGNGTDESQNNPSINSKESGLVNQTAPAWVLTFVQWENRDTLRNATPFSNVRGPLVVESDCIMVTTNQNKGTLTPNMSATLLMTDINYETAVAPGDFVFVNMLDWEADARRVADQARARKPINGLLDGFKGLFKIQSVRKVLRVVDPENGTKAVAYKITGFGFTEFNNSIYFNPYLVDPGADNKNQLLFASLLGENWKALINKKAFNNVQDVLAILIQSFIGTGVADAESKIFKTSAVRSKNQHFFIPALVGTLLNVKKASAAKDIYNYVFGIQNYSAGSSAASFAAGMNPAISTVNYGRFYYTAQPCEGNSLLKPEFWNQVKAWSILNQYTNAPLNELYTCFRVSPNGSVMPTVVFRQIPFTTEDYTGPGSVTKFLSLPRWKINPALISELDIGRDESARVNFMQYFGKSNLGVEGADIAFEIAQKNYVYDIDDVQRSGLRPYIVTTQFDDPTDTYKSYRSPKWAQIVGNAVIGGHLKMNGSLTSIGISKPIAVGDNLELDDVVYHIEQVSHMGSIDVNNGKRIFNTVLSLSSGVSTSSSKNGTRYAEMTNPNAYKDRQSDSDRSQLLPGIAEDQAAASRPDLSPSEKTLTGQNNLPFPQPRRKNRSGGGSTNNGQNG